MKDETVNLTVPIRKRRTLKVAYNYATVGGVKKKIAAIKFSGGYLHSLGFDLDGFYDMVINEDNSITIIPNKNADAQSQAEESASN